MDTHDCPDCGKPGVAYHMFAHKLCWYRLPKFYRDLVWQTYRVHGQLSPPHVRAMLLAQEWYRNHPRSETTEANRGPATD